MKFESERFFVLLLITVAMLAVIPTTFALFSQTARQTAVAAPAADPQVTVAHFAPFATDAISTSVTIRVNGSDAFTNFEFGNIATTTLPAGSYLIEILPTGTSTVAISGSVVLTDDASYTVAAIGDGANQPLALLPLVDDTEPLTNAAKLRAAHLAPFAMTGTEVDICTDDGMIVIPNFGYGAVTAPYATLPAGDYDLQIALAGTNCGTQALDLPSLRLADGDIVDVFAIGGANGWPLDVASITGFNLTPAQVSVAHFAPFASAAISTSVTVRLNGTDAITGFEFSDILDVELPSGDYLVEILPDATGTVAISGNVTLDPAGDYTLAAIGDGVNQALELFPLLDDTTPLTDSAKLRVAHLAPFAATGTEVDICTDSGSIVVPNVAYKAFTDPYLTLPAGDYDLQIALAGTSCANVALDLDPFRLADGEIADVFAIGGANGWPLSIATASGLNLIRATVNVGHFAPFASETISTSVTVRLNGADAIPNFVFGDLAVDVPLTPGDYLVEIVPTGTTTPAITTTVTLSGDIEYTLAAIGDGTNQPLELVALVDDNTMPMTGTARVRIGHYAPFAADINDTRVDICTEAGAAVVSDVPYKGVTSPYLELPAGFYDLKVTAAGSSCGTLIFDIPLISVGDGDIVSIYAVGGANGFAPTVITAPDISAFMLFMPVIFRN